MHVLFGTNLRELRPLILEACEGKDDIEEIPCNTQDIRDVMIFGLEDGMADDMEAMKAAAEGN